MTSGLAQAVRPGGVAPRTPHEATLLANRIFFARHPERRGRPIARAETPLVREWMDIRARLLRRVPAVAPPRPVLPSYVPPARAVPGMPVGVSACPIEDPFPLSIHKLGVPCAPDGRKCWAKEGWADIVDPDMPCNDAAHRSPAAYASVLDYFNVDHPGNARYAPDGKDTYCNIYVHDVTRAMRASVPHWVRDPSVTRRPVGWRELGANATFDWMGPNARQIGWILIDAALAAWIARQRAVAQSAANGALPAGVASAAARIAAAAHPDPRLLQQDTYLAQQFANLGLPSIIVWRNEVGPGHVAMVRPESTGARGAVQASGAFLPISAQAGAVNFRARLAKWIVTRPTRRLYVHE
jgi:hypothetical protein